MEKGALEALQKKKTSAPGYDKNANRRFGHVNTFLSNPPLVGGFNFFLFSSLFGEDSHFD